MVAHEATAAHYDLVLRRTNRRCPQVASDNHRQGFCFAEDDNPLFTTLAIIIHT